MHRAESEIFTPENLKTARETAAKTFVLLKNENQILPLKMNGTIALIGPLADNKENMLGTWAVAADFTKSISVLQGIKDVVGNKAEIMYARGANFVDDRKLDERISIFGKPTYTDDRSPQELLKEAIAIASKCDVIVAVLGEAAEMSGESSSRSDISLPENQRELLKALLATGKPIVMVLFNGRALALPWENANVPAILDVWFGGTEAGHAIADVLFGRVNPSGKLPVTFPQNVGQVPLFYNHKNTGRPLPEGQWFQKFRSNYLDVSNDPLYPFGYGLSYTQFTYGELKPSSNTIKGNGPLTADITVTNSGKYEGTEIVQLYIRDLVGSVTRPVKELKGFQKISLKAGETRTVSFTITPEDLKFYNYDLNFDWEPGDFEIMIGGNSRDVKVGKVNWTK
jgi:beta-glucosidase